ncbi:hypothetical protein E2C01_004073 [Portunus trituberculatus]|uniref:Uncharacterized protein n=1 Tax=Portunus trituberculatus TaxID=210409 RepID=A0A5B7CPP0_PORTR|nr:hypothetical protein [Portunus trituberculatus]
MIVVRSTERKNLIACHFFHDPSDDSGASFNIWVISSRIFIDCANKSIHSDKLAAVRARSSVHVFLALLEYHRQLEMQKGAWEPW